MFLSAIAAPVPDRSADVREAHAAYRAPVSLSECEAEDASGPCTRSVALLVLEQEQLAAQHAHGRLAVLDLGALVLALHHGLGGDVGDAHGGVGLVDVLAAGAGRAVGLHPQVLLVDLQVTSPSMSGVTSTDANEVWRRLAESKGEMRTRRWTPRSVDSSP